MATTLLPTTPGQLPEVRDFLIAGFDLPHDAECVREDVLHWKYFDPRGTREGPRSFLAREGGALVGHMGFCPTTFCLSEGNSPATISTLHMTDWLAKNTRTPVGMMLLMQAFRQAETQYNVGGTAEANQVQIAAKYQLVASVQALRKVLSARYYRAMPHSGPGWKAPLRILREVGRQIRHVSAPPTRPLQLQRVESFGNEVTEILQNATQSLTFTSRNPELLNHFLRYPVRSMTGWLLRRDQRCIGLGILNISRRGRLAIGKIVECLVAPADPAVWQAAVWALTDELRRQQADVATVFASSPAFQAALRTSGYYQDRTRPFLLRDPRSLVPRDRPFHLTLLEADLAYI